MMAIMGTPGAIDQASRALPACLHVLDHRKLVDKFACISAKLALGGKMFPLGGAICEAYMPCVELARHMSATAPSQSLLQIMGALTLFVRGCQCQALSAMAHT